MVKRSLILLILLCPIWPAAALGQVGQIPNDVGHGPSRETRDTQVASLRPLFPESADETDSPSLTPLSPLSLADLEAIALERNPTLAAAAARIDAARGRQVQAGLYPNPVIGYHATEIGNQGTAGQQGGFFSQKFITGGKLRLDRAAAGMETNESRFLFDAQERRVLSDVRIRFFEALVAQRRVELTKELARIADQLVAATERLLAGRQVSENDLLLAEIEAEETHDLYDQARNEEREAWRRLAAVIGEPAMPVTPLAGELDADLPSFNWEESYAMVLAGNPELDAARTRVDRARFVLRRATREPIPDIDVLVSVRHHNVTGSDVANLQVGLPIPIFDRNQGNISKAQAEWIAASREVQRIELDLQDRLAVAYRRYANARQQADRYRSRILPRARKSLELVTGGYDTGQVDYLTLITSQQTYVRVNLSYLDALRELREAAAIIEGQLLTDSLANRR